MGNNFFGYCDEGGLFPHNLDHFQFCEIINEALIENSINPGKEIAISIDVAASNFYNNKIYQLYDMELDKFELTNIFEILVNEYNVKIIEDPYEEKDISSFSILVFVISVSLLDSLNNLLVVVSKLLSTS